jgi:carbamoyltransferase
MANIAFYGSHNSAVVVEQNKKIVTVIEIERFTNRKNCGYSQYMVANSRKYLLPEILKYIKQEYGISEYETCLFLNADTLEDGKFSYYEKLIPAKEHKCGLHHLSHASCGFYQTDYKNALIVSYDGGGNDGFFNIYHAKDRKTIESIYSSHEDLGFAYMSFGEYLGDIRLEPLNIGNLVYSGKIMGLASYGTLREEWLDAFEEYYRSLPNGLTYKDCLQKLSEKTGLTFDIENRYTEQIGWDIAKTSQMAFENVFMSIVNPFLEKYPNIPLVIVGGCGLNILLNTKLNETLDREVFVPPNPNDCGIATGLILNHIKPNKACDITYAGIDVLDKHTLMSYCEELGGQKFNVNNLVKDLSEGRIVGVVRGRSEHGPRALGNRSILCNPAFPEMKDTLNAKVKNREWYRPFAPVCRLEDVNKYFNFEGESRWMSFCPTVKEEWREQLASITHVDGTARVQTVTKKQNPWLYNLLSKFEKKTGVGVLLNTSFNINGKPILSTYADAIEVYRTTQMDRLLLGSFYFKK